MHLRSGNPSRLRLRWRFFSAGDNCFGQTRGTKPTGRTSDDTWEPPGGSMVPSSEDLVKGARQSLAPVGDLEAVLRRKLNEARIVRECNATETRGSDGSARIKELGVVEEVERFSADLERLV